MILTMQSDIGLESVEHDPEEDRYRVTYDRQTPPSVAVPAAVQEITGKEMRDLEPIHAVIDPDALDELFQPPRDTEARSSLYVTFTHEGHTVTVYSDRRLVIRTPNDRKPDSSPIF